VLVATVLVVLGNALADGLLLALSRRLRPR
ncbi:MAG: hypothetical protein QOI43_2426, partial [Gaiellales bacterium]|nr:hypothetical protein [Gaiellales bacterium]